MDELVITVKAGRLAKDGQLYEARLGDELLCIHREAFLEGARVLHARGIPGGTPLAMKYAGDPMVCLRSTVGKAARLVVEDSSPPKFRKLKPKPHAVVVDEA